MGLLWGFRRNANMPFPAFCRVIALPLMAAAILPLAGAALAQNAPAGLAPFTQAEVTAGHASYVAYCASCHGETLQGGGDAPPLGGGFFSADWSKYNIAKLYAFVSNAMPQGLEGELKPEEYSDIIAFLLAADGARPGTAAFDKNSSVTIGSIISGVTAPAVINAPVPNGPAQ
jgi:cytochrome c